MTRKSSIDQEELNKFNRTYEQWWDRSGEFKTLHDINPIRIKYITDKIREKFNIKGTISDPLKNLDIIDVGCGGGLISMPMSDLGSNVTCLDANENNIKAASDYAKQHNLQVEFVNSTVEEFIFATKKPSSYDVVLCLEVIEHVANPPEFVQNLTKLLKPNGLMILSTINRTLKSYLQAIIMAEYVLGWMPRGTHDYNKFVKPSELKKMIQDSAFDLQELMGLKLNPLLNEWYLADDIDVNYFACIGGKLQ
jgi:2-polyprenyl-6-hydroxyphenyl methylase/3-demethylubiquinone-9 3-methyltransferase